MLLNVILSIAGLIIFLFLDCILIIIMMAALSKEQNPDNINTALGAVIGFGLITGKKLTCKSIAALNDQTN